MAKNSTTSARRALRVLKALRGHSLTGLSNKELAEGLRESPPNVTRALQDLEAEGLATKLDTGRWALSVAMLQLAHAYTAEVDAMQGRIVEMSRRVAAGAMR
jgi:DNA-binding IclR family transcriptional regulator